MDLLGLWQQWMTEWGAPVAGMLAVYILLSGLDDLALDLAWLASLRRMRPEPPFPARERRIAVLVPLWREADVIGPMLEHNLSSIRYSNYEFHVGVYPNDGATAEAVRRVAERDPRVHLAEVPHDGPTSKADCLNWIYQRLIEHEQETGVRAEIVVIHDAEDVIHPDSFARFNRWIGEAGMLQEPVLAMPTPLHELTHGVYCDDFAESQMKDLATRAWLGGFLPGCGVGTAFRREELDRLAEAESNRIFDPRCLTEDYDNGVRLHRLGCRQMMLPLEGRGSQATATREYFPRRWRAAVRQRTRWITGNSLQAWEVHGWGKGLRRQAVQAWFFWRDRKGLWGSWIGVAANALFLASAAEWAAAMATGGAWSAGAVLAGHSWLAALLACNLGLFVERAAVKMGCTARVYGWRFAAGVPLRMVWGNSMNAAASARAAWQFFRSKWTGTPLRWLKTEHLYPSLETLRAHEHPVGQAAVPAFLRAEEEGYAPIAVAAMPMPADALPGVVPPSGAGWRSSQQESFRPSWRTARALPKPVSDRLNVVPVAVTQGWLEVAGPGPLNKAQQAELQKLTSLPVRYRPVDPLTLGALRKRRDETQRQAAWASFRPAASGPSRAARTAAGGSPASDPMVRGQAGPQ